VKREKPFSRRVQAVEFHWCLDAFPTDDPTKIGIPRPQELLTLKIQKKTLKDVRNRTFPAPNILFIKP